MNSRFVSVLLLLCMHTAALTADQIPGPPRLLRQEDLSVPVDSDTLMRQFAALSAMPSVDVTYTPRGTVEHVRGNLGVSLADAMSRLETGKPAPEILGMFKDILLAKGDETLIVRRVGRVAGFPFNSLRFDQYIDGKPVIHGALAISTNATTGIVERLTALFLPNRELPREPKISADEASALALDYLSSSEIARPGTVKVSGVPSLAYYGAFPDSTRGQLVWQVNVKFWAAESEDHFNGVAWIDAIDGSYVGHEELALAVLSRTAFSAGGAMADPNQFPSNLTPLGRSQISLSLGVQPLGR